MHILQRTKQSDLSAGQYASNDSERQARTLRGFQKFRHKVNLLQKEVATAKITTALQVIVLKRSSRAIISKSTEKGEPSLLPQPVLASAMEEKVAIGSPHSQKMKHRFCAKTFGDLSCNH